MTSLRNGDNSPLLRGCCFRWYNHSKDYIYTREDRVSYKICSIHLIKHWDKKYNMLSALEDVKEIIHDITQDNEENWN